MMSRVVPASSETMAASRRASALSRLDLPALGGPAMATLKPSRRISPRRRRSVGADGRATLDQGSRLGQGAGADIGLVGEVDGRLR